MPKKANSILKITLLICKVFSLIYITHFNDLHHFIGNFISARCQLIYLMELNKFINYIISRSSLQIII